MPLQEGPTYLFDLLISHLGRPHASMVTAVSRDIKSSSEAVKPGPLTGLVRLNYLISNHNSAMLSHKMFHDVPRRVPGNLVLYTLK